MKQPFSKPTFYILSWTWGIIMTLIGNVIALIMILAGYKPIKNIYGWYFEVGNNWGGVDLGYISIIQKNSSQYLKNHEFGHAVQNCIFGPFFPFIVAIPSAIRYWYRTIRENMGKNNVTDYYDIWFEKQASDYGIMYYNHQKRA